MAKYLHNKKRSLGKKIFFLNFITSKKTALMILFVAVFSFIWLGFVNYVYPAAWTDPHDSDVPPDSIRDQSPINIGPQRQDKNGPLILQGGLETDNHFNIYNGDLNVTNGNVYVYNRLYATDSFGIYPDLDGGKRTVRVGICDEAPEVCDAFDLKELQVKGRTLFRTQSLGEGIDSAVLTVSSNTITGPALLGRMNGHSVAIYSRSVSRNNAISIRGIGGDAGVGRHTFGVYGLAGQREDPYFITAVPYAGYFEGMLKFAEPAYRCVGGPDDRNPCTILGEPDDCTDPGTCTSVNQPFYINSDITVTNLNTDLLDGHSCDSELNCDLCLKDSVVAAMAIVQTDDNTTAQPGGLNLSGQAQFDGGVETNGLNVQRLNVGKAFFAQGSDAYQGNISYAIHSEAGSGSGDDYAAYFSGPVYIATPEEALSINSRASVLNLNAERLNGYQASDFKKYSDLGNGVNHLDNLLIRLQTTSPGFFQNGHLSINAPFQITGSLIAPRINFQQNGDLGTALEIEGSDLPNSYALYAEAVNGNQTAGRFEGDVKILNHNLYLGQYIEFGSDNQLAGTGTILAGQTDTTISSGFYDPAKSLIFTSITDSGSPIQAFSLVVTKNPDNFTVSLFSPGGKISQDIYFNYFIINQQ